MYTPRSRSGYRSSSSSSPILRPSKSERGGSDPVAVLLGEAADRGDMQARFWRTDSPGATRAFLCVCVRDPRSRKIARQ